jgi:hypothetical protein
MSLDELVLPGFDQATGMLMLPWWVAAAVAALLLVVIVVAMARRTATVAGGLGVMASLALVVAMAGVWVTRSIERERADDRRALAQRAQELTVLAMTPGSTLACLDAVAGEAVEAACEKALFESPQAVSAAASYVASRIALLSDGIDFSIRANTSYEGVLPGVRRALEIDRYGFVAHVLAMSYGCSPDNCEALVLFRDPARITANLKDKTFDTYVARHAGGAAAPQAAAPQAAAPQIDRRMRPPVAAVGGPGSGPGGASPVPPGFEVPSAASIPPVSIMAPEPGGQPNSGTASSEAAAVPPIPPRRPTQRPARPAQTNAPTQLVPPAPSAPLPGSTGAAPRPQ